MENTKQEILAILWHNIRLVAHPLSACEDCGEPLSMKVKDGCLETIADEIMQKFGL